MASPAPILHWYISEDRWTERYPRLLIRSVPNPTARTARHIRIPGEEIIVQLPNHRETWTVGYSKTGKLTWLDNQGNDVSENTPLVVRWAWTTR